MLTFNLLIINLFTNKKIFINKVYFVGLTVNLIRLGKQWIIVIACLIK